MQNGKIYRDLRTGNLYRCVVHEQATFMIREVTDDDDGNFAGPVEHLFDGDYIPPPVTVSVNPSCFFAVEKGNCG